MYKKIQNFPVSDSTNNDAFEAIVELYFQLEGYITSSGKWFWVWEEGKQQRGYQDIDVLAVGESKTIIVSVTSNLDDKIRLDRSGNVKPEMLRNLKNFFDRAEHYLGQERAYPWLIADDRVERTIAYGGHPKMRLDDKVKDVLRLENISLLSAKDMIESILEYLDENKNLKIQSQILRTIQTFKYWGLFQSRDRNENDKDGTV